MNFSILLQFFTFDFLTIYDIINLISVVKCDSIFNKRAQHIIQPFINSGYTADKYIRKTFTCQICNHLDSLVIIDDLKVCHMCQVELYRRCHVCNVKTLTCPIYVNPYEKINLFMSIGKGRIEHICIGKHKSMKCDICNSNSVKFAYLELNIYRGNLDFQTIYYCDRCDKCHKQDVSTNAMEIAEHIPNRQWCIKRKPAVPLGYVKHIYNTEKLYTLFYNISSYKYTKNPFEKMKKFNYGKTNFVERRM